MSQRVKIVFAAEGERTRRVVSRSNCRVTGKHPGFKSGRMHYWESFIERDAFTLLEADPHILSFAEQPAVIYFGSKLKQRHYPDLLITSPDRREFVEIKTDRDADNDEVVERTALLTPALACHGYSYRVWRSSEIRDRTSRLSNLRHLLRFGRAPVSLVDFEWFRRIFEQASSLPWGIIVGKPTDAVRLTGLCRLVLEGKLQVDLEKPIFSDTVVTRGEAWK